MRDAKIFSLILLPPFGDYLITLEEREGDRLVPIWIGSNEGNAIALHLQSEKTPRPLTHDLFANVLKEMGAEIKKVVIADIKESTYYAKIDMELNGKNYSLDARPSDSLALAVRMSAPIYIAEEVFEKSPVIKKPITEEEAERFKEYIKDLKPEDFFKDIGEEDISKD